MDYQGLQTLFQSSGPATSAWSQGEQDYQTQREKDLTALAKQQEIDQATRMNPLKVQQQELLNRTTEAELPGKEATSRKLTTEANISGANEADIIAQNKRLAAINQAKADHDIAVRYAAEIGNGPDAEARKRDLLLSGRIKPGTPIYEAFANTPAKDISASLQKRSELIEQASDDYIKEMSKIRTKGEEDRKLETLKIEAGKYKKNLRGAQDALEKALSSGSWDKAATAYDAMAQQAIQQGEREDALFYQQKAKEYSDKYLLSRQAPRPGTVDIGGATGLPTNPAPTVPSPALKGTAQPNQGTTKSGVKFRIISQ